MANNTSLYDSINRLRAFVFDSSLPEELTGDLMAVCDAAEEKADTEQNFFDEF